MLIKRPLLLEGRGNKRFKRYKRTRMILLKTMLGFPREVPKRSNMLDSSILNPRNIFFYFFSHSQEITKAGWVVGGGAGVSMKTFCIYSQYRL